MAIYQSKTLWLTMFILSLTYASNAAQPDCRSIIASASKNKIEFQEDADEAIEQLSKCEDGKRSQEYQGEEILKKIIDPAYDLVEHLTKIKFDLKLREKTKSGKENPVAIAYNKCKDRKFNWTYSRHVDSPKITSPSADTAARIKVLTNRGQFSTQLACEEARLSDKMSSGAKCKEALKPGDRLPSPSLPVGKFMTKSKHSDEFAKDEVYFMTIAQCELAYKEGLEISDIGKVNPSASDQPPKFFGKCSMEKYDICKEGIPQIVVLE